MPPTNRSKRALKARLRELKAGSSLRSRQEYRQVAGQLAGAEGAETDADAGPAAAGGLGSSKEAGGEVHQLGEEEEEEEEAYEGEVTQLPFVIKADVQVGGGGARRGRGGGGWRRILGPGQGPWGLVKDPGAWSRTLGP